MRTNPPATQPAAQPTDRPAPTPSAGADRPTATYPTHPLATAYPLPEGWRIDPAGYLPSPAAPAPAAAAAAAAAARLAEADATPTQVFPIHPLRERPAQHEGAARAALWPEVTEQADAALTARAGARVPARVYHTAQTDRRSASHTRGRRERPAHTERRQARRAALGRHLRAALAAIALAAALLSVLQAYAASGITTARQAALAARDEGATPAAAPTPPMSGQTAPTSDWVTQDTGAPFDRTNPHASPLTGLPRCTTAPDTPLPCLAHVSANSDRAVILEEDGSLTALVPSHTR